MSNVIDFLERMGRDAQLRHASSRDVELALACAQIDPELQATILAKDQSKLEVLLGQATLCCMQFPAKEEEEDEDGEESPSRDHEDASLRSAIHVLASVG
jgi:hypothetical protein